MTRIAVGSPGPAGTRWPHPVNGRLLFAEDLTTEQEAVRARDRWLGRAIGPGVAEGFEVTGSPASSVLAVSPGTGVSPGGTAVHLDAPATLDLAVVSSSAPVDGALFADCRPTSITTKAPTAGAYVLVVRPASHLDGKVAVQGPPGATLPTPCTSRWDVEDVVFAAIPLDGFTASTTPDNRRNLLAHWCFGSDHLADLAVSGFTAPVPWSPLAELADLSDCDVPLAVFDWDGTALTFVDRWSARRRPVGPSATVVLDAVVGDDRTAEGEARFLQFQDQLTGLLATPEGRSVQARDVFPVLPPAGLVPIDPLRTAERLLSGDVELSPVTRSSDRAASEEGRHQPIGMMEAASPMRAETGAAGMVADEERHAGPGAASRRVLKEDAIREVPGGASTSHLGAVSEALSSLQTQVEQLQSEIAELDARTRGRSRETEQSRLLGEQARLAGFLVELLVDTPGTGVDAAEFFAGLRLRVGVVDSETVDFTLRRSWYDEPVTLGKRTQLDLFFVLGTDGESLAPYVLFTKRRRGTRWVSTQPGNWWK